MAALLSLPCTCGRSFTSSAPAAWQRQFSSAARLARSRARPGRDEVRYNFNPNPFDPAPVDEASRASYPVVTAEDLKKHTAPPRKVRLLARDFIDDSLYNPNYGYFPKKAVIFDPDVIQTDHQQAVDEAGRKRQGFDFASFRNMTEWNQAVADTYGVIEEVDAQTTGLGRQPWYAQAIAHHLATEYKLSLYPYNDLNIYEIGAGNGSLMAGILDFLQVAEPEVYERTRYNIIEISGQLSELQKARAKKAGHSDRVTVTRQSIFDWDTVVSEPCFFLAFEVLDNLSHDVVRYTVEDNQPLQCLVEIDERGDFSEVYEPVTDPLIKKFLRIRRDVRRHSPAAHTSFHPLLAKYPALRRAYGALPFAPNLSPPDFLPTKSLLLLQQLRRRFPAHRMLMSDFDYLPDTIPGRLAPVVQTRYEGRSVACSTYLVSQGWFDIFFPTDFRFLRDMYDKVMQGDDRSSLEDEQLVKDLSMGLNWGNRRPLRVLSHKQFLERYGEPEFTTLQDGTNPMLDLYENAAFIF